MRQIIFILIIFLVTIILCFQEYKEEFSVNNNDENLAKKVISNSTSLKETKSQLGQDLFVLTELNFKKDGYFIEFGATNGVDLSNTYILEKKYGWKGIVAEPGKYWHEQLKKNRTCNIDTNCIYSESDLFLTFNETDSKEISTIDNYSSGDLHSESRKNGTKYQVKTITLIDLLDKYNAPKDIDYLSIDTEGSEYDILKNFDFNKYNIKIITCEHNNTPMRQKIYDLLTKNGYKRKFEDLSQFDDWYIRN